MGVAVTKAGPYFNGNASPSNTNNIKFSQMRDTFRLTMPSDTGSPGSVYGGNTITAGELRRNTDRTNTNPIVPDCTENADIGSVNDWKVSQIRDSIKYYYLTQTGTDINFDIDASAWNSNINKTILKWMNIDGTCGSNQTNNAAAQLDVDACNLTIDVAGNIYGARGAGGTLATISGEDGGTALYIAPSGSNANENVRVHVQDPANIYGGGGGGEKALNGATGNSGTCSTYIYKTVGSGCNYCGDCGAGWERYGGCAEGGLCDCFSSWGWTWCNGRHRSSAECRQHTYTTIPGGTGGEGGDGGQGRGYNNMSNPLIGDLGQPGGAWPGCPNPPYTGGVGSPGTAGDWGYMGASGGDWGTAGDNTPNTGSGGAAGRAIDGSDYTVIGVINIKTVRGEYNP